jgi:hypothetical protein
MPCHLIWTPIQWDAVEDKPTVLLYGGGAVVALWLTSVVVGAINAVPLVCPCVSVCVSDRETLAWTYYSTVVSYVR